MDGAKGSRHSLPQGQQVPVGLSVTRLTSTLIGAFFLVSVGGKLFNPDPTLAVLRFVWGFGTNQTNVLFVALGAAEAGLGISILLGLRLRIVLVASAVFILLLTTSIVRQLVTGSTLACGCGLSSGGSSRDYVLGIVRNAALAGACAIAFPKRVMRWHHRSTGILCKEE